jgi:hypothetical protein
MRPDGCAKQKGREGWLYLFPVQRGAAEKTERG